VPQRAEELEKLDRLKSEMVAITSHDLKAPLHAIIGYADILKTSVQKNTDDAKHIDRILKNSHDMVNLIREILNLDKIESGKYKINTSLLKVDDILKSCIDNNSVASREKEITIKYHVIGETKPFYADKIKLDQLFNNIISNAVKFSPANSEIQVIYKTIRDEKVEITICDNGPGIPDKDIKAIFNRYYQADPGEAKTKRGHGTGLGLYISKEITKLHSGKISVENRKEGGCCFLIQIPFER